jgi:hypothetical protein
MWWSIAVSWACSFEGNLDFVPDPLVEADAPVEVEVTPQVTRGVGPRGLFSQSSTSCDDLGWLELDVAPALPDQGLRVHLVPGGVLPDGLSADSIDGTWAGNPRFVWIDDATDDQEPFELTFELTPVNAAGLEGETFELVVADAGGSGCASVSGSPSGLLGLGALLVGALRQRQRGVSPG